MVGIYSGTFDPVHPGHIAFAVEALRACGLAEVVFLPEQTPRNKQNVTDITHRIDLIKKATSGASGLRVVRLESPQFTVKNTLPELQSLFGDTELTLLVGSDVVRTFLHSWEDLGTLLRKVRLAIGIRANDDVQEITAIIEKLAQIYNVAIEHKLIYTADADIASSHIKNGRVDTARLQPIMLDYIRDHRL